MKVTIKDIAKETGLSLATISKYLNNKKIQEKNRIRIEEAITHLGYKPNRTAQVLRSKRTMTVAIVISDLGNYFWGAVISSITQFFVKYGYTVITCSFYYDSQKETEAIQDLIVRNIDGVIMLPYNSMDSHYSLLQKENIPVVVLDQTPDSIDRLPVDFVTSDNYNGGMLLGRYLLGKGHKKIHILDSANYSSTVPQRIQGFQDAYKEAGTGAISVSDPIFFYTSQKVIDLGKKHFRDVMSAQEPPTAIFFTNYLSALGGLMEANISGLSIPRDISVITFDDDPLFGSMYPPITSVSQDMSRLGQKASEILYRRMNGDYSDFPLSPCIDVSFCERQSVRELDLKAD